MKFEAWMHAFYQQKLNTLPAADLRLSLSPAKRTGFPKLMPAVENAIGYSLLVSACLHYILTGRFFMIVQDLTGFNLIF